LRDLSSVTDGLNVLSVTRWCNGKRFAASHCQIDKTTLRHARIPSAMFKITLLLHKPITGMSQVTFITKQTKHIV
jgi:hypothetical protein